MSIRKTPTLSALAGAAILAFAGQAAAVVTLTITDQTTRNTNQPEDIQCLIIGNSCPLGQQNMDYFAYAQGGTPPLSYNITADPNTSGVSNQTPAIADYTVKYLQDFIGSRVFDVGIDVNTTGAQGEMLRSFEVRVNGGLEFEFQTDTNIGAGAFNGNGYFDWTLSTIDLSGFGANDIVTFKAVWDGATDGPENFFLYRNTPAIPEPGTYALMLAGLGAVGFMARRRRQA